MNATLLQGNFNLLIIVVVQTHATIFYGKDEMISLISFSHLRPSTFPRQFEIHTFSVVKLTDSVSVLHLQHLGSINC